MTHFRNVSCMDKMHIILLLRIYPVLDRGILEPRYYSGIRFSMYIPIIVSSCHSNRKPKPSLIYTQKAPVKERSFTG